MVSLLDFFVKVFLIVFVNCSDICNILIGMLVELVFLYNESYDFRGIIVIENDERYVFVGVVEGNECFVRVVEDNAIEESFDF